jgi:hypothetical protein
MDPDASWRSAIGFAVIYYGIVYGGAYLIKSFRKTLDPIILRHIPVIIVKKGAKPLFVISLLIIISLFFIKLYYLKIIALILGLIVMIMSLAFNIINKVNELEFSVMKCPRCGENSYFTKIKANILSDKKKHTECLRCVIAKVFSLACGVLSLFPIAYIADYFLPPNSFVFEPRWLCGLLLSIMMISVIALISNIILKYIRPKKSES